MRGQVPQILWVLLLPILLSGLSSPSIQAASSPSFEAAIYEVCPDFRAEFIVLKNTCSRDLNLTGWSLSDGEGSVIFVAPLIMAPEERLVVTSNRSTTAAIYPDLRSVQYPSEAMVQGRFLLANDGDDLWLRNKSGAAVDYLVYGSGAPTPPWIGPAVKRIPQGEVAQRTELLPNLSSAAQWAVVPPGRSSFQPETSEAVVEPFSCPENALARLVREIDLATSSIQVSVYELSSSHIVDSLSKKSESGVDVDILIEGQPVSGLSNSSIAAAQILSDKGCDVRMIKTNDSYRRYDFLHCKYLLIDGRRSVVLSENLGKGLSSNRGWGVVVDSQKLTGYLQRMFLEDFRSTSFDVRSVGLLDDHRQDFHPNSSIPGLGDLLAFRANISVVVSPDNSYSEISKMISSARSFICIEQLEFDARWIENGLMEGAIEAAKRGVQVRMLLDSTWSSDVQETVAELNSLAAAQSLDLVARCTSPHQDFEIMHNKGLIVDECCLISSINWVNSALYDNREVGLIIDSKEVTAFFRALFSSDWTVDSEAPEIHLEERLEVSEGNPIFLNASGCYDRSGISSYTWDLGGDGTVEWTGERCLVSLPRGEHTILLKVTDTFNNSAVAEVTVKVLPASGKEAKQDPILIAIMVFGAIFIFSSIWRSIKLKK